MRSTKYTLFALGVLSLFVFVYYFQWMTLTSDYLPVFGPFGVFQKNSNSSHIDNSTESWEVPHQTENNTRIPEVEDNTRIPEVEDNTRIPEVEDNTRIPEVEDNTRMPEVEDNTRIPEVEECPENPPNLIGPLNIDLSLKITMDSVIDQYKDVEEGGHFKPANCRALQRIAIIIPFRNRDKHLVIWLHYMHAILQRQQGEYGVYVVEQAGDAIFNRAKLMNVGFTEAQKEYNYGCFIFTDIDLIPMNDRNLYRCGNNPRHMANAVDKFGFRLLYDSLFGGIVAFTKDQFVKVNGFSNLFWGWGGEDDEMYKRVVARGMRIERPDSVVARSKMIRHNRDPGNENYGKSVHLIDLAAQRMHQDGLSSLEYQVVNRTKHKLYTKISVDIGKPFFL